MEAGIIVLAVLLIAFLVHRVRKVFYHFRVVEPGRLYRSGTLGPLGLRIMDRVLGINTIINLRSEEEYSKGDWFERQSAYCRKRGMRHVLLPMHQDTPPTPEQVNRVLEILEDPQSRCLIHCEMGVIRTGMVVVAVQRGRGLSGVSLWRHFPLFGHRFGTRRPQVLAFLEQCAAPDPEEERQLVLQSLRRQLLSGK